jgi:hypothetical protein
MKLCTYRSFLHAGEIGNLIKMLLPGDRWRVWYLYPRMEGSLALTVLITTSSYINYLAPGPVEGLGCLLQPIISGGLVYSDHTEKGATPSGQHI